MQTKRIYITDNKTMSNTESHSYAGQPEPMPMPTSLPVENTSSSPSVQSSIKAFMKIGVMDDYPHGRGGMQMMPIVSAEHEQPAQSTSRPGVPIGARPPATEMPTMNGSDA
jgi:hypothetical protein